MESDVVTNLGAHFQGRAAQGPRQGGAGEPRRKGMAPVCLLGMGGGCLGGGGGWGSGGQSCPSVLAAPLPRRAISSTDALRARSETVKLSESVTTSLADLLFANLCLASCQSSKTSLFPASFQASLEGYTFSLKNWVQDERLTDEEVRLGPAPCVTRPRTV